MIRHAILRLKKEENQIRLFNVFPLNNLLEKNIYIDTSVLISNFLGDELISEYVFNNMIWTDMISCYILFIRLDKNG